MVISSHLPLFRCVCPFCRQLSLVRLNPFWWQSPNAVQSLWNRQNRSWHEEMFVNIHSTHTHHTHIQIYIYCTVYFRLLRMLLFVGCGNPYPNDFWSKAMFQFKTEWRSFERIQKKKKKQETRRRRRLASCSRRRAEQTQRNVLTMSGDFFINTHAPYEHCKWT